MLSHNHVPDRAVRHIPAICCLITMSWTEPSGISQLSHNHVPDRVVQHIPAICCLITMSRTELSGISQLYAVSSCPGQSRPAYPSYMLPHNHVPDRAVRHIPAICCLITMSRTEPSGISQLYMSHNHVLDRAVRHIPAICFPITMSRTELSSISQLYAAS